MLHAARLSQRESVRLISFLAEQRLRHLTQAQLLHFGAIGAFNDRNVLDHHNSLRNFEARQPPLPCRSPRDSTKGLRKSGKICWASVRVGPRQPIHC